MGNSLAGNAPPTGSIIAYATTIGTTAQDGYGRKMTFFSIKFPEGTRINVSIITDDIGTRLKNLSQNVIFQKVY